MAQYPYRQPRLNRHGSRGFTLVEVLVASVVLLIGVVAVAGLIGSTLGSTSRSGYMNQAASLATEKLEDLNRYPRSAPQVTVNGSSVGSLTSDVISGGIPYYDEVYFSPSQGGVEGTTAGLDSNGNTTYTTTTFPPGGQVSTSAPSSTPPGVAGETAYERRWVIEQDVPVTGVRRVTVLVTLVNQTIQPPVTFQISMVRPRNSFYT